MKTALSFLLVAVLCSLGLGLPLVGDITHFLKPVEDLQDVSTLEDEATDSNDTDTNEDLQDVSTLEDEATDSNDTDTNEDLQDVSTLEDEATDSNDTDTNEDLQDVSTLEDEATDSNDTDTNEDLQDVSTLEDEATDSNDTDTNVQSALPEASTDPGHSIRPGDWVCTKNFQRQRNLEPRWREPRLVLLTTRTAVKVEGKKNWVHAVHCKKVPLPLPFDQWVRRGISDSESEKVPQFVPFSDARLIGTLSEKEDDDILQEAIPSHRRLNTTNPGTLFQNQTASGQERYNLRPRPKNL
ncbi:uncharacterized protein [Pleurodeles waltl]|uniref:uncharacterized protein isoform X1 n=1 Tax=Pleurodeles waltl TaxID=8319 RepID=UPI003709C578